MDGTLEQARAALQVGSFDVAEAGFRAVLGDTDGIEALHCLGLIAQQRGDLAGSLMLIQAAHHLAPSARMAHNLAVVLSGLGRTDEAIAQALAAANLDLTYVPARFGLAALLVASGALSDAAGVLLRTAEKALRVGNQDVARQAVDQLLLINADHPSILMLANMLRMVGWETDAHRLLAIRLRVAPDDIGARLTPAVAILTPVHPDEKEIERQRASYTAELADIAKLTECASREQLIVGASTIGLAQPFLLGYHGCDVRDLQCRYGRVIVQLASAAT
jgi:tetratricopeptide (TPR) repeat protein